MQKTGTPIPAPVQRTSMMPYTRNNQAGFVEISFFILSVFFNSNTPEANRKPPIGCWQLHLNGVLKYIFLNHFSFQLLQRFFEAR